MGIKRNENGGNGTVFLRINAKAGCVQHALLGEDGKPVKNEAGKNVIISEPPTTVIEGLVTGLKIKEDEYEGVKSYRAVLTMADVEPGQPRMQVEFPFASDANGASFFGMALLAKLNNADLTKPVALMPWLMEAGTKRPDGTLSAKDATGVTVYQGGMKIKENFGDGMERLPQRKMITVRGKEQVDPTDTSWDGIATSLVSTLQARLTAGQGEAPANPEHEPGDDAADLGAAVEAAGTAPAARPRFAA